MKKRISAMVALALALTMLFSLTALAAPSTSATNTAVTTKVMTEYAKSVTVAPAAGTSSPVEVKAAGVLAYDAAVNAAASLVSAPAGQSAAVKAVFEVKLPKATAEELAAGVTLTFTVPGFRAGANYAVLHMDEATKVWDVRPTTVNADGTVSAVFNSLSPVAIVEVAAGSTASPKTADGSAMAYALVMIALCGMAVVSYRKATI